MKYVYLVASLPCLSLDVMPPLQENDFLRQCEVELSDEDLVELQDLLDGNAGSCTSEFGQEWFSFESAFRHHIAEVRAGRIGLDPRTAVPPHESGGSRVRRGVVDAFAKSNPLERERSLDTTRWNVLDELARQDPFGLSGVLRYALQIRLASRWSSMNDDKGLRHLDHQLQALLEAQPAESL